MRSLGGAFPSVPKTVLGTIVGIAIELAATPFRHCRRVTLGDGRIVKPLMTTTVLVVLEEE
jgi:hypothetical protein